MLRAAGIEAHVALLSVGPGPDLEPSLPGIGAFDHAIVYVPGEEPLWLDPTAGFAQPGQIPWADQGRLALIAAAGSAELSRIPEETGLVTVTREIYLAEEGPGRVVEVGEASGWSEIELRAQYGAAPESQLRQTLEEYAESVYGAEDIGDLSYGDPRDFETPFEARAEIIGSRLVNTVGGAAAVYLPLAPILSEVMFLASVHDGWRRAEGIPQTDVAPASDLLLPSSQTTEWRYQIVPPPGFRESGLPESRSESLGVGMLSWEFSSNTDHTVEGLVRFESGGWGWSR
jgi:hypothetical protein